MKIPKVWDKEGFTLVELIVVIAIIGLIAAIAIPRFNSYKQKAYDSAALSDIKYLQTDLTAYFSAFKEYPTTAIGGVTFTQDQFSGVPGLTISPSNGVTVWFESSPTAFLGYVWHIRGSRTYGLNQKGQLVHFATGINLIHGTLADNLASNQSWQDPWIPL